MVVKVLVVLLLFFILFSLGSGLFYLVKDQGRSDSNRVLKALTWRIGLSLGLFLLLMLSMYLGWLTPHGLG